MTLLNDPQMQNSYSYGRNNPIILKDPTGLISVYDVMTGRASWGGWMNEVGSGANSLARK